MHFMKKSKKKNQKNLKGSKKVSKDLKPENPADNLKPESRLAKAYNKSAQKAAEVGEVEVATPTPKKGLLGKRVDPFKPVKWFFLYVKESYQELKKTTWLSRKDAWKLTGTVALFSFIMAMFLFGLDSIFSELFKAIFLKD